MSLTSFFVVNGVISSLEIAARASGCDSSG
jgi:hypothetical protein